MEALLRGLLLCMWELSNFYELSVHDVTVIINYLFSLIIKNQDRIFNKKKKKNQDRIMSYKIEDQEKSKALRSPLLKWNASDNVAKPFVFFLLTKKKTFRIFVFIFNIDELIYVVKSENDHFTLVFLCPCCLYVFGLNLFFLVNLFGLNLIMFLTPLFGCTKRIWL